MQDMRLLSTYQKAKSEYNCRNDRVLSSSDLSDLFQQWVEDSRNKDSYIRYVGLPLYAIMFSQEQLDIINTNDCVAHFDATGTVVRKPRDIYSKRIMYYTIVVKKGESIIPIAEMITSEHDIPSISILLKRYRQFTEENRRKWPLFKVVMVDWSWALINSLMYEWNKCNIIEYLEHIYFSLDKETPIKETFVIVHTCCAHFMKRVSSYIQKKFPKFVGIKTFVLECIAVMLMSRQLLFLDEVFEEFITILLTPKEEMSHINIIRLNQLRTKIGIFREMDFEENEEEEEGNQDFEDENIFISEKNEGRIFNASPFFERYNYKYAHLKERIQKNDDITNKYYNPEIAEYVTYKLMPFVPMWSSILLSQIVPNVARLSNAYVESYFNVVKNEILQRQANLKIGRFIDKMKNYKCSLIAEAMIKVPIKSRKKKIKRLYPESPLNPFVREMWQRRQKAKYSLMEGRQLSKIAKKCESTFNTNTPVCDIGEQHKEILMQQSNNSTHNRALNNGLFLDIEYYMQDTEWDTTVGYYFADRSTPILSDKEFYLFSDQFKTLKPNKWIDGTIIDCFVVSQINSWKNIVYVPTDHTSYILGDFCDRKPHENWLMYNITEKIHGKVLLPYLYQMHWRLLVLNVDEKTISVLDPYKYGKDNKRAEESLKKFLKDCPNTSLNTLQNIQFKQKIFNKRPFQKDSDGNNCGVYILYYIKCIAEGTNFGSALEPTMVREEIAEILLNKSYSMKETCLFCFNMKKNDLVMCILCRRWAHYQCIGKTGNKKTIEEWADPKIIYTCNLCQFSVRNWMINKD